MEAVVAACWQLLCVLFEVQKHFSNSNNSNIKANKQVHNFCVALLLLLLFTVDSNSRYGAGGWRCFEEAQKWRAK